MLPEKPTYEELEQEITLLKKDNFILKSSLESPKNIIIFSLDKDCNYLYFNDAHNKLMNFIYNAEIQLGKNIHEFMSIEEDRINSIKNFETVFKGNSLSEVVLYGEQNKSYFEIFYNPLYNEENKVVGATVFAKDITKRIIEELSLKENKELLIHSQRISNIGSYIVDFEKNTWKISEQMYTVLGIDKSQLLTYEEFLKILHPDSYDEFVNYELKVREEKTPYNLEYKIIRPLDNKVRWVHGIGNYVFDENHEIIKHIGTVQDITERKKADFEFNKAKEKADENEMKYQHLVENLEEGIWLIDKEAYTSFVNPKMCEILGYTMEEMIGKHLYHFMSEESINLCKSLLENRANGIKEKNDFEFIHKKGHIVYCLLNSQPFIKDNQYQGSLAAITDISERRKMELELKESLYKAEQSEKLKKAFLQNMSHEIRTPLNAIVGFSNILKRDVLNPESRERYTDIIINSSNQLLKIIDDVLTASILEIKEEIIEIEEIRINKLLSEIHTTFKPKAENQNTSLILKQNLLLNVDTIKTDETKFRQIISNLLNNAFKFTKEGSVEFGYTLKNNHLEFFVKDNGIGIDKKHHHTIFERFNQGAFNTNQKFGGTGLGLSISKSFIELLGGNIWLESELGEGTTFYFTLPYENSIIKEQPKEEIKKILVAEDEYINFVFLQEILSDTNAELIYAKNGKVAVDLFKSNPNISLVLMDIRMPIMDGNQAAKAIKEINPNVPIIAQSAFVSSQDKKLAAEIGFVEYLTKPINTKHLTEIINKYI